MYSIIIAVAAALLTGFATGRDLGTAWGIVCGVAAFLIAQLIIMLVLRKKLNKLQLGMQQTMQAAQVRIQRQVQNFQQRPVGSPKLMQQKLEAMQNDALHETLRLTAAFDPYYRWNWMLARQINTMKMQLYFQLRDFARTDQLLPKCLLMDAARSRSSWSACTGTRTRNSTASTGRSAAGPKARTALSWPASTPGSSSGRMIRPRRRGAGRSEEELRQPGSDRQLRESGQQPAQTLLERRLRGQLVRTLPRRTEGPPAEGAAKDVLTI